MSGITRAEKENKAGCWGAGTHFSDKGTGGGQRPAGSQTDTWRKEVPGRIWNTLESRCFPYFSLPFPSLPLKK